MVLQRETYTTPNYMTIKHFCLRHEFITEDAIRWMIHKDEPDFKKCFVRFGKRKILINEEEFFKYIKECDEKHELKKEVK